MSASIDGYKPFLIEAQIKNKKLTCHFKVATQPIHLVHFTKSMKSMTLESTFLKDCVFCQDREIQLVSDPLSRGRLNLAEVNVFQKQQFTGKQRAVISDNGFWHQSFARKLCCVFLSTYTASCLPC
jgi:hypothetical protein